MLNPTYLYLSRHNVYYFRWPVACQDDGSAPKHVKLSLSTRDPKQALLLGNALAYHALVMSKEDDLSTRPFEQAREMLKLYFANVLGKLNDRLLRTGPMTDKELASFRNRLTDFEQAIRDDHIDPAEFLIGDTIPEELSIEQQIRGVEKLSGYETTTKGTELGTILRSEYRHAAVPYYKMALELNASLRDYDRPLTQSALATPSAPVHVHRPEHTLQSLIKKYLNEMDRAKSWGERARDERVDCLAYLTEYVGERTNIAKLSDDTARAVKDALLQTPTNRKKLKQTKDLPLAEQLQVPDLPRLSAGSINKYLQVYSGLCDWAVSNKYIKENPFKGMSVREAKGKKRDMFKPEAIRAMLDELHKGKAGLANTDTRYWGPLIALYTGARLNEISSLTPNDIKQDAKTGIWYFDINDEGEQKRVKTEAAKRRVPVHSELIRLGLINHVEHVRSVYAEKPNTRLLYDLTYRPKEGWGRNLGRWFNDQFLPKLGLKADKLSFHSIRHTVITNLRNNGADNHVVRALVGHEAQGVTEAVYMKDYELGVLQTAIERLEHKTTS